MFNLAHQKLARLLFGGLHVRVDRELIIRYIAQSLPKTACIVDVGAGTGSLARSIIKLGSLAPDNVHLIEAMPETFANMHANNLDLHCHHYAVARTSGVVTMYAADSSNPLAWKSATLYKDPINEKFGKSVVKEWVVPAISLSDFYATQHLESVDLMTLNCEGAEYEIFDGDTEFLERTRMVWIELHGRAKAFWKHRQKRVELYDLFQRRGFVRVGGHKREDLTKSNAHMTHLWERL